MRKILKKKLTLLVLLSFVLNCSFIQVASAQPDNAGTGKSQSSSSVEKPPDSSAEVAPKPTPKSIKKVCLIVVPGLTTEAVNRYTLPNIGNFAKAGIISKGTVSSNPTTLDIDLANLFSGNEPENHKYSKLGDKFKSASLFTELAQFGRQSVVIDGTGRMKPLTNGTKLKTVNTALNESGLRELFDQYIDYLSNDDYYANVLVLPSLDSKDKNKHYQLQELFDRQFARVISNLVNQGIYDHSLVVIAGVNGSTSSQTKMVTYPLVMNGPQLITNAKTPVVGIYDIVPTLLYLTTQKTLDSSGLVMWDLLDAQDQNQKLELYQRRISELSSRANTEYERNHQLYQEIESFKWEKMRIHDQQKFAENTIREKKEQITKLETKLGVFKFGSILFLFIVVVGYILEYFILRKRFLMF